MLYTIFGITLIAPLALLVGSLVRTAVGVASGKIETGETPATVLQRSAKFGAPQQVPAVAVARVAPRPALRPALTPRPR